MWLDLLLKMGLGGVIVFFAGQIISWRRGQRRIRALWGVVDVLIHECAQTAANYTAEDAKEAPLYRIPIDGFDGALGALLAEAVVPQKDYEALIRFAAKAKAFNRGLDQVAATLDRAEDPEKPGPLYCAYVTRCRKYATEIRSPDSELFRAAVKVVSRHLKRDSWWRRCLRRGEIPPEP